MSKKTLENVNITGNNIIMQVKENQKALLEEIVNAKCNTKAIETYSEIGKEHGRVEERITDIFPIVLENWPGIITACTITRNISHKSKNQFVDTMTTSYYISNKKMSGNEMNKAVRNHWGIENSHHHIRDTVLMEDSNRIRVKPENMMVIRSFGYNLIQSNMHRNNFTSQMESNKLQFEKVFEFKGVAYANKKL